MDINPKQFVKSNSNNRTPSQFKKDYFGREDDDPLSIRDASISFIGILLAMVTVLLPSIGVLLERPSLQNSGVISNQIIDKDGY